MYAIIRAGGKQYTVSAGDTVRVEKMEKKLGEQFNLAEVLMVGGEKNFIGAPLVQNAVVTVVVTRQAKAPKIIVFKKKRRQGYRRLAGHRQLFTELFVKSITTPEGHTFATEKDAQVIDPIRTKARKDAAAAKFALEKKQKRTASPLDLPASEKKVVKKKAAGQPVGKKTAAASKPAKRKTVAKKATTGKKAGKKATAKK